MKQLLASLAILVVGASPAAAQTSQGTDHSHMHGTAGQLEGAVQTRAVIHSIGDGMANVTHDPIPEIGWPAMTMDLAVMENAQMMGGVVPGDSVILMLVKGADGMYAIGGIMPE